MSDTAQILVCDEVSLRRAAKTYKAETDVIGLMDDMAHRAWKRGEAKMDDDRAAMFRRNCLGLAGRMIKHIDIARQEAVKYTDDEQIEAAMLFYKYIASGKKVTSSNNAQAARHDAITHSVTTDNRQTPAAAVTSAKKYLKFLEGAE